MAHRDLEIAKSLMKPAQIKQWAELRNRADSTAIYKSETRSSPDNHNGLAGDSETSGVRLVSRIEYQGTLLLIFLNTLTMSHRVYDYTLD